jgi:hypothetical protein
LCHRAAARLAIITNPTNRRTNRRNGSVYNRYGPSNDAAPDGADASPAKCGSTCERTHRFEFSEPLSLTVPSLPQKPFAEIKAGLMNTEPVRGTTKTRMAADPRKGSLQVVRDGDGTLHVKLADRVTGNLILDCGMAFPEELTLRRIATGTPTDRVYELRFKQVRPPAAHPCLLPLHTLTPRLPHTTPTTVGQKLVLLAAGRGQTRGRRKGGRGVSQRYR